MHIVPLWQKFKQLGFIDQQMLALNESNSKLTTQIADLILTIEKRQATITHLFEEQRALKLAVELCEVDIAAIIAKITAKEERLDNAHNAKELHALEHEIEVLKRECSTLEDRCLDEMTKLEAVNNVVTTQHPLLQEQHERDVQQLAAYRDELAMHKVAQAASAAEHEIVIASITSEWLAKYQDMKKRSPNPIAPVVQGCCSACFYEVLAQDLTRLKLNAILPCRSCFRLLYCDTEEKV
jgi:predicted  nucleic acid-binding Zn-ribbon protein